MKADQERVRMLITQTITMLCKKGLEFETELKVQGLLGVTVDSRDIFLIHLNEKYDNVSDTKDFLPRQESSVATSTGNEKTQFSPQDISPDNGTECETAYQLGADSFGLKRELQPVSPLQPNFPEFQDSMSDLFPYAECHTTEGALLTSAECGGPGFLMDAANPTFSTNMPPDLKDIGMGDKFTGCGGDGTGGGGGSGGGGVILLDSGDEAEEDLKPRPQSLRQLSFGASEMDSKGGIQMMPEHKMAYSPETFRPSNVHNQQNAEMDLVAGSSQSWALQPVSRSQFPLGQMNSQGQRMQFNPDHIGKFTIGSNRPPAVMSPGFRGRGASSRRPGSRQPRPTMPGSRGGLVSPMKPMIPNDVMGIRHSGSPTAGGSMLGSPPPLSSYSPGTPRPVRGSPSMRGAPRGRGPRAPGAMLRGAAVGSSAMMEFASGVASGSPNNHPGAPRMARGSLSVRSRNVDGYSYGKQTVTNYICNICNAVYKNHSSLLTHQVKVHGRQKKEGVGRPRMQPTYDQDDDNSDMEEMGEM